MVGRPFWSGQLKVSLVSFGIQLYPAVNAQSGINFHQIDRATGERVRHRNVVNEDKPNEDKPIENAEIVKGYEYSKGKYLTVEPDEIKRLRVETKRVIEIQQFVDLKELPPSLFEKPYFVIPDPKSSPEAYAVVHKAMEQSGKAAIGEVAFGGREHLVAFAVPTDKSARGLMAYTLRYSEELRKPQEYFGDIANIEVDKKQLAMATDLIKAYSSPFQMDAYKDDYETALRELIEAKQKDLPLPLEEEETQHVKSMGLMDALRASLKQGKRAEIPRKRAAASVPKKGPASERGPVLVKPNKRRHRAA